ncbi:MAG: hypothetical protein F6K19_16420 [Cyanothece sp. SIO1E1]|nr:hypothetical protein [Cyanothece sp. SIO1E1]
MAKQQTPGTYMRVIHRYLGFFLAGIMAVYALSGIVLVFRNTDFLKKERKHELVIAKNLPAAQLGEALKIRRLKVTKSEGDMMYFDNGSYQSSTGKAEYTTKRLPYVLDKMTKLHKANTNSPLYWLNIFFGVSLLFFVVSAFWMFRPTTSVFRKGLYFTMGGILLTLLLLFV